MTRASLDKKPADVAAMFDGTAERYDLLNTLMTGGQDRRWRREAVRALDARPGERILDLAAGTGTSSVPFAEAGADTVACDFSLGMLRVGVRRQAGVRGLSFVAGDALSLPFADGSFDAVTISFGLRNVADTGRALRELRRVARPGGRLLVCEVSHPPNALLALGHKAHLKYGLPLLARVSSNPDSYRYLAESTLAWPDQAGLARLIQDAGWDAVRWRDLTFGVAAMHHAVNPG
ncbi:demethylmenaquinone methyltransferase / 2-methoxy-6-polyprenyl-1,4-benzoquinol methylase [Actinomadura meyerae]|jgi:demethylmenaquinone methyltransferase/2-methoxy-6-polyprenyl-1,4-benzoquinol methylase|uniref:Demethylmenaquinone methyltransferase n=1 Tax=Actinomadura meyerae TaxID=240840 RepID=A0A239DIR2_9ACTN|nr:demethylmenaquinone methyltransferase [Actinomadura meyerae]SNS32277.1 demethylmenaquinone methyltransferase / 2-methoxy-6-polyprenyl-1,4-benzoquinol methylase [Actinomadura meyerae]